MKKPFTFTLFVVFACGGLSAQKRVWQPSPRHTQVPMAGCVPFYETVGRFGTKVSLLVAAQLRLAQWLQ